MPKTYGQIAYEAYCADSGGKSLVSGAPLPTWEETKPEIRGAWHAAANAVVNALLLKNEVVPK